MSKRARVGLYAMVPLDLFREDMVLSEVAVYAAISSFQGGNKNAWPSREAISERCGYTVTTVSRATKSLEKKGWIQKKRRSSSNQTNVYTALLEAEEVVDRCDTVCHIGDQTDVTLDVTSDVTPDVTSFYLTKRTIEKNNGVRPAKAERPQPLSQMKDPVAQRYQELLTSETPHTSWKSIPAERKHLSMLAKATERLGADMLGDADEESLFRIVDAIFETFRAMKSESQADFWKNAPVTPSSLFSRWDSVIERFRNRSEEDREYQQLLEESRILKLQELGLYKEGV